MPNEDVDDLYDKKLSGLILATTDFSCRLFQAKQKVKLIKFGFLLRL